MTTPGCYDPASFDAVDGALTPQPWLQWRHVAGNATGAVDGTLPVTSATATNALLTSVVSAWTNNSPIPQIAYAMVTRGGAKIVTTARSGVTIDRYEGTIKHPTSDPVMALTSRFGNRLDFGVKGGPFPQFGVLESRAPTRTVMLGPALVLLQPGETFRAKVELRVRTDPQESVAGYFAQYGEQEMTYSSGESRIDVFAEPVIS